MATSVTSVVKHFPVAQDGFTTTTSGSVASGATSVGLTSVGNYSNGDVVALVIDPDDSTKKQVFTGTIDTGGTQVTGVKWTEGTNQTHAAGATVVDYETATAWAMYSKGLLVEHAQAGTHADITTTSINNAGTLANTGVATFTTHIDVNDSSTAIRDSSDNELVKFSKTTSAVNEVTLANAATGNGPTISATGGDTNIDINLTPKGSGVLKVGGNTVGTTAWSTWSPSYSNITVGNGTIAFCSYTQIGKTVHLRFSFTLGSTSSVGSTPTISLPVTAASDYVANQPIGVGIIVDAGTTNWFATTLIKSTTTMGFFVDNAQGDTRAVDASSTKPMTWASGDQLRLTATYEAA